MSEARRISNELLKRKLVASTNMLPIASSYFWKNKIRRRREVLMVMKTRSEHFAGVKQVILAMHSYEVPGIVALKIFRAHNRYLRWIDDSVMPKGRKRHS
jgi:uncharacterized protein involved in tolerance to divalent cations